MLSASISPARLSRPSSATSTVGDEPVRWIQPHPTAQELPPAPPPSPHPITGLLEPIAPLWRQNIGTSYQQQAATQKATSLLSNVTTFLECVSPASHLRWILKNDIGGLRCLREQCNTDIKVASTITRYLEIPLALYKASNSMSNTLQTLELQLKGTTSIAPQDWAKHEQFIDHLDTFFRNAIATKPTLPDTFFDTLHSLSATFSRSDRDSFFILNT